MMAVPAPTLDRVATSPPSASYVLSLMATAKCELEWELLRDDVVRAAFDGELPAWWWPLCEDPDGGLHDVLQRTWND
jgi:hypothetical protein